MKGLGGIFLFVIFLLLISLRVMSQLGAQATHGGRVFLLIWGLGALVVGLTLASKTGVAWFRAMVVSGLQG